MERRVLRQMYEEIERSLLDGKKGLLVPSHDAATLAKAILSLLDDPKLHGELSRSAQRDARQLDFGVIVPQELQVLLKLLAESTRRTPGDKAK